MIADLHTHTTASDGQYTPTELVHLAKQRGLDVLAITDHDTIDGLEEAISAGAASGLQVVRGVELGAKEYRNLHILGYNFQPDAPVLGELCQELRAGRDERKYRILDFLQEKGIVLSLEEVEACAGGDVIARPHFAQVMVKRGYVATTREAFDRYLDTDEYKRIERKKVDAQTCLAAIKAAGGKTCLAHPYQLKLENDALTELVQTLVEQGLDAIECFYPQHTPQQTDFYLDLARRYGLHCTGGSDFHGERVKPDIKLSALELNLHWLGLR